MVAALPLLELRKLVALGFKKSPNLVTQVTVHRPVPALTFLPPLQPTERPSINSIVEKLEQVSRTPTWTNVAYQKYYGPALK